MAYDNRTFNYRYTVKASDIWQVRMYYAYASYLAMVNIICITASIILIVTLWNSAADWLRFAMLIFLSLFTVVQPLFIYMNCVKQVSGNNDEIVLDISRSSITVETAGKKESYGWDRVVNITVKPTLVIIYTDASHGYILTNRILKDSRKELIAFLKDNKGEKKWK